MTGHADRGTAVGFAASGRPDVVCIKQIGDVPFAGIYFGGHASDWGPDHYLRVRFRDFPVSAPEWARLRRRRAGPGSALG